MEFKCIKEDMKKLYPTVDEVKYKKTRRIGLHRFFKLFSGVFIWEFIINKSFVAAKVDTGGPAISTREVPIPEFQMLRSISEITGVISLVSTLICVIISLICKSKSKVDKKQYKMNKGWKIWLLVSITILVLSFICRYIGYRYGFRTEIVY